MSIRFLGYYGVMLYPKSQIPLPLTNDKQFKPNLLQVTVSETVRQIYCSVQNAC